MSKERIAHYFWSWETVETLWLEFGKELLSLSMIKNRGKQIADKHEHHDWSAPKLRPHHHLQPREDSMLRLGTHS